MSKTLRFGSKHPLPSSRIDRFVIRRRTTAGYDKAAELALADYARQVALEVTPTMRGLPPKPQVRYASTAPSFGKRS